jgi:inorganic pyrophosphatase
MMFEIEAIVEIPQYSKYKFEMDKKTGGLVMDRILIEALPYTYGFVPCTLHEDGDPLDICIFGGGGLYPLTKVKVKVLGAFLCKDNGFSDHKLVATLVGEEEKWDNEGYKDTVQEYLSTYKDGFTVEGFVGVEEARKILMKDLDAYQNDE